jgi:hypothetical protein
MSNIVEFPIADRPITESEVDKLHSAAFRDLEPGICDCTPMAKIAAQMVLAADDGTNREFLFAVAHVCDMLTALKQPNPFPPGAAVYEWHYTRPHNNPDGTCRFSVAAANYSANNVADAQIVLAFQTVGSSQQIPFYYFWITSMGRKKPDFVMLQSNAAVSFIAQGMTMHDDTGPITSESDQHVK